jgi:tetratricopeptide (TPR) repeat protein
MYKQALSEKNDFAEAWLGLGAVYFKKGNIDEARQAFEKCITIDSKNLNACLFAAACCDYYINRNQDAEANAMYAIKLYEKANRLNPDNPEITLHLGFLYFRIGDCSKCVKYLKQVVGYPGLTTAQQQQVSDCLAKCGH